MFYYFNLDTVFVWMFLMLNPSFVDLNFWNLCTILDYSVSFIGSTAYSIKFLSIHAILNKQYFSQVKTFLHHWFIGRVDATTKHVLTWSQYKIFLIEKLTYLMQVHIAKWSYTVNWDFGKTQAVKTFCPYPISWIVKLHFSLVVDNAKYIHVVHPFPSISWPLKYVGF